MSSEVRTFCRTCLASCGLVVTVVEDRVEAIRGDQEHPLSAGYACPKGRAQGALLRGPDRLLQPAMGRRGDRRAVGAAEIARAVAACLGPIIEAHGPDAVGSYFGGGVGSDTSGWIALQRLLKVIGTRSRYTPMTIDAVAKPVVATLVAGNPALTPQIDPAARFTLILGTNPVVSHGHASAFPNPTVRLRSLAQTGTVYVIDPRATETARLATRHLAARPGSDVAVLGFLVSALLHRGADTDYLDRHVRNVEALRAAVARFDLDTTARLTGLPSGDLAELLDAVRSAGRIAIATGTGSTMSAQPNVTEWLAWCLGLVTGSIDRRGGMWFNPGYLKRAHLETAPVQRPPGPGPRSRPELRSRWGEFPAVALVDEIEAGNVRALLVIGANPIASLPETARVIRALESLEVLVVADIAPTHLSAIATHVLPSAAPLERSDMTHIFERMYQGVVAQYTPAVVSPAGDDVRPVWWWCAEIARGLGHDLIADINTPHPSGDDLLATLCPSDEMFARLRMTDGPVADDLDPFGWVLRRGLPHGYFDAAPVELLDQLARTELDSDPGLVLSPRRQRKHLNSVHVPGGDSQELVLSAFDAAERSLSDGDPVRVSSSFGSLETTVRIDPGAARGVASLAHGHEAWNVNHLTTGRAQWVDEISGMPIFSGLPVTVTPLSWPSTPSGHR